MTTAVSSDQRTGRSLISGDVFASIVAFVVHHEKRDLETAERITDQALAFVATAAESTLPMVPSDDVDMGLHAFILHTREYREFCQQYAGRFLDHNARPGTPRKVEDVTASAHAIKAAGFVVFDGLWSVNGENAAQCDSDCGRPYGAS
ncbi:glycine-rich domain-containing protein [Streptomyces sp. NPDC059743]|uniref:glycine-rich domain-containing protein n=1 Tax=Streptomyces sp. NPDC059743 TaxID=3346928 RepID=UPI0036517D47